MKNESEKYLPSNVFEGMTSVRAIVKARDDGVSDRRINEILYDKSREAKLFRELSWLSRISARHGFALTPTTSDRIDELTLGKSHGGIVALCGERTISTLDAENIADGGFYVMLDGIEDPYNFGTAVRSVYASGADGIILPPRSWMSAAGIVCRSSAGASELSAMYEDTPESAIDKFKSRGYKIVASDKQSGCAMYDADLSLPVFLIVGGELRGISKKLMPKTDITVRIDYGREFPAALSAQSSAAVLAFEVYRQNHVKNSDK